ncbi:hypothetical protein EV424DRAFT_1113421 [Suillus variegatus]|nr:hypothetical protein EV424DRAFT_1113421 [Suillus variegatus]
MAGRPMILKIAMMTGPLMSNGRRALLRHRCHHDNCRRTMATLSLKKNSSISTSSSSTISSINNTNSILNTNSTSNRNIMMGGEAAAELGKMLEERQHQRKSRSRKVTGVKPLNALWMSLPGVIGATKLAGNKTEKLRKLRKKNGPLRTTHGERRRQPGLNSSLPMHHRRTLRSSLLMHHRCMPSINRTSRAVGRHGGKRHEDYPRVNSHMPLPIRPQQSTNPQWSQQQAVMSAAFRQQQEQAYALAQAQSQHKQLQQQQHRHVQQQHSETYALAHAQNQHRLQHHHQNQPQHHQNPNQLPHHQNPNQSQHHQNQNQPQHHHDPSQPQHYHQPQHHHDPNQPQHYHNPNQPQHHHDPNQQQHYHTPNQPQHHHDQNQPQHHQDSNQPQHEGKKHKKDKESKQNKKEKKRQQKEQQQQEQEQQQQHDNDVWGLGEGWQDEDDPDDYEDTHDAWGRRVHFSPPHTAPSVAPSTVVENFIVNAFPPNKLGLSTLGGTPSKTLTYAYHGTAAPMENRPARNTTHDFADFIESKGAAISSVAGAFFGGNSRMAKDRFHWMFPPDKDERVASKLEWIQSVSPGLGSFGLQKFLQTRERGALIVNADYRPSKSPNEPAFDWLTYPELQKTMDRTLQESVAFYDPSALVVVFVFLPSKSGNSLAIWRRKIAVPSSVRLAYQAQITQALNSLHRDYSVYVDEIPPPKSEAPSPPKKRKWWKLWLST